MRLLCKYRYYPKFCMKGLSIHTKGLSQDIVLAAIWSGYLQSKDLGRCRHVCCLFFLCLVHFSFMWRRISVTTVWSKYVLEVETAHEVLCKAAKHSPTVNRLMKPQNVINKEKNVVSSLCLFKHRVVQEWGEVDFTPS